MVLKSRKNISVIIVCINTGSCKFTIIFSDKSSEHIILILGNCKTILENFANITHRIINILKEQTSAPKLTKGEILFALDKFRKLDLTIEANRERLIDSLVQCIILYDDKLVITFNFKNEPVTVPTSDELEAIEDGSDIEAFASPKGKDKRPPCGRLSPTDFACGEYTCTRLR